MMRKSLFCLFLVTVIAFTALPVTAQDLGIILSQSTLTGAAGTTLTFDASLTNLSTSTVFLNGDSFTTVSPSLTVSDNPFLTNAPLSLSVSATSGPFVIFTVTIAPGTAPGVYSLNDFTILGGLTGTDFNVLGSTNFTIDVVSAVPESGTLLLVGSGLLGLCLMKRPKAKVKVGTHQPLDPPESASQKGPFGSARMEAASGTG
jgi:hypothetical protein